MRKKAPATSKIPPTAGLTLIPALPPVDTEDGPWVSAVAVAELEEDVDDVGRSELEGTAADDPAD